MPKLRKRHTSTKKEGGAENLSKSCCITLTRMSLKDIAAELNVGKANLDCQISEEEINQFLASQSAIAANKVPIYRRKVILAEKPAPRNDVYQFNFDAASELQTKKGKNTRKTTRKVQAGGIRKRKAVKIKKIEILDKTSAVPSQVTTHNDAGVRRTRASSTQLRHPEISIREPLSKASTSLNKRTTGENVKENIPNESVGFVELEITDSNITDRRIAKVRQFGQSTSTPIMQRKSVPTPFNTTNVPVKSPWRIQEGIRCPKTFYFSCSNDLMPSYASDVISDETSPLQKSTVQEPPLCPMSNVCESFEANNSNAENICPYIEPNKRVNVLSNVVLKPAANRSPLKQMEIIGLQEEEEEPDNTTSRVSTLATHSLTASKVSRIRKFATKTTEKQSRPALALLPRSVVQHEESASSECAILSSDESATQRDESNSIEDAFGFYTTGNFDEEFVSTDEEQHNYSKNVLKQRLKSLKKLAPRESTKTTRLPCKNQVTQLFRSPRRGAKPKNIREMFEKQLQPDKCSTPQRSAQGENESLTLDEIELTADDDTASIRLFNDPVVPEVVVIGHPQRRSYSRILAKKRKKVVGFVAVSDDENNSDSDTDAVPIRTKKLVRTKRAVNVEETTEFKAFVVAMNKEFAEVEKYELVIN